MALQLPDKSRKLEFFPHVAVVAAGRGRGVGGRAGAGGGGSGAVTAMLFFHGAPSGLLEGPSARGRASRSLRSGHSFGLVTTLPRSCSELIVGDGEFCLLSRISPFTFVSPPPPSPLNARKVQNINWLHFVRVQDRRLKPSLKPPTAEWDDTYHLVRPAVLIGKAGLHRTTSWNVGDTDRGGKNI